MTCARGGGTFFKIGVLIYIGDFVGVEAGSLRNLKKMTFDLNPNDDPRNFETEAKCEELTSEVDETPRIGLAFT